MSIPYFAFFPKDWLADTGHLSYEERGVYFDLLCHMWIRAEGECALPDDNQFLANLLRLPLSKWKKLRAVLIDGVSPVLVVVNGRITNKRLAHEYAIAQQKSDKAAQSARTRWKSSAATDDAMPTETVRIANAPANALPTICYTDQDKDLDLDVDRKPESNTNHRARAHEDEQRAAFDALPAAHPPSAGRAIQQRVDIPPVLPKPSENPEVQAFVKELAGHYPHRDNVFRSPKKAYAAVASISRDRWPLLLTGADYYAASADAADGKTKDLHNWINDGDCWQWAQGPATPRPSKQGTPHATTRPPDRITSKLTGISARINALGRPAPPEIDDPDYADVPRLRALPTTG